MLLVVVHVLGRLHVLHVPQRAGMIGARFENLPKALLRLGNLASVLVDHGEVQQGVNVRLIAQAQLLVHRDRVILFPQQIEEVGQLELILGVVANLDGLAKQDHGLVPVTISLGLHRGLIVGLGRLGVDGDRPGTDHRVKDILTHHDYLQK